MKATSFLAFSVVWVAESLCAYQIQVPRIYNAVVLVSVALRVYTSAKDA